MESSTSNTPDKLTAIQPLDDNNDEIDLLKLARTLWARKWSIVSLTLIVMLVTALVVLSMTPIYRAISTLLIEKSQAQVVSIEQMYGIEGSNSEYLQTQFELIRSRSLAERVVRELNLMHHPEFDPRQQPEPLIDLNLTARLRELGIGSVVPATLPEDLDPTIEPAEIEIFDQVVRDLRERITVSPVARSQLVHIQVDMADPQMAARTANALANGFIEQQMEARMEMSMTATNWMNTRLDELRDTLRRAENRLQEFREKENLVDVGGVATISANELSLTGDRMIDARRERAEAESQYRQVQAMRGGGWQQLATIPAVLGHPLIQQFRAEQARARARVDELSKRYGRLHPTLQAAQSDLNAAEASLRGQVEQIVAGIERNYQLAVANENSLRSSFNANREQIQDISRKEFELRELQREVDTNRALYDTFLGRLRETTATSDLESANARIVDRATIPAEPIKPKKTLIVAIAGLLAAFVGIGLTLLLDALNNTFRRTEDVEQRLNLPVLGIVPLIKNRKRNEIAHLFSDGQDKGFSESIRTIRTGVVLASMENPQKVMVVTSSIPGEGKSTVAANLAMALGQMEKVLLIDADMRRPTLAKNFDFTVGTPGLANLIAGTAKLDECVRRVEGIDMMCAGSVPPNPLELLSSPRFSKMIEFLRSKYDRIIIDSPPTQAVSDAVVLATHANALLYVIKAEATAVPLIERGVGHLLQNRAPITGIVLNQVDIKKAQKYGYEYGGYYDYYGYSDSKAT
ncbi:GumC family protein [Halopseudomonas salegens]|uniref:non-specific protein-tyrosine kinase n=1 Tax=Halopseudomonas salegens TaxID=1434072 RepID=A0A1H2FL50_9GAMM|nr:polysaccharide biosynthesis tyrosine autokinase [Halopseudomonas salegens]SDU08045.1 capsular exopolysaccharide family [Halopseudomonas salegens]